MSLAYALVCVATVAACIQLLRNRASRVPLPRGPRCLPFVGSVLDWPRSSEWTTLADWGSRYGEYTNCTGLNLPRVTHRPFLKAKLFTLISLAKKSSFSKTTSKNEEALDNKICFFDKQLTESIIWQPVFVVFFFHVF